VPAVGFDTVVISRCLPDPAQPTRDTPAEDVGHHKMTGASSFGLSYGRMATRCCQMRRLCGTGSRSKEELTCGLLKLSVLCPAQCIQLV
jgi:hypothetical protein